MIKKIFVFMIICLCGCNNDSNQYIHFTPPPNTILNIEFDYPANWVMNFGDEQGSVITLYEENITELPHRKIGIYSFPSSSDFIFKKYTSDFSFIKDLKSSSDLHQILKLRKAIAVQVVNIIDPTQKELPTNEPYIFERVYIISARVSYYIILITPESERHSNFGQGFDHLIATLKIIE
jgi:hypothetical protein